MTETIDRAREALLKTRGVNLGSGPHYAEGWVNVDLYDPPEGCRPADVRATVFDLSNQFPAHSFKAAYLGHFLEHLEWERIPAALEELRVVLEPGAPVMAVGPCIYRAIRTGQPESLIEAILADPEKWASAPPGCHHAWTPTTRLTARALQLGGFEEVISVPIVSVTKPDWPNPSTAGWQTAAQGRAPK